MKIIPTWPIAVGALVIGLAGGAFTVHGIMESGIQKLQADHTEELRVREVQRAKDEVAAREEERRLTLRAGQIEQEKTDEIARIRSTAAADLARLQNRPDRKPTPAGAVSAPVTACAGSTGAELSRQDGGFLSGEAARANELRAGLAACYHGYDSIGQ